MGNMSPFWDETLCQIRRKKDHPKYRGRPLGEPAQF